MYNFLKANTKLIIFLIGGFALGWAVASYERNPQIVMPEIVEVGDVLFTGTFDAPYRICVHTPYESCGPGCEVPENDIYIRASSKSGEELEFFDILHTTFLPPEVNSTDRETYTRYKITSQCKDKSRFESFALKVKTVGAVVDGTDVGMVLE